MDFYPIFTIYHQTIMLEQLEQYDLANKVNRKKANHPHKVIGFFIIYFPMLSPFC